MEFLVAGSMASGNEGPFRQAMHVVRCGSDLHRSDNVRQERLELVDVVAQVEGSF